MTLRDLPNVISLLRILLVVPVAWLLLEGQYGRALILFAVAGISDGLDGFLAKHYGWTTRLGSILDPLADKLLLVTCYLTLGWLGHLPWWLVAAVLARDVIIVAGALAFHLLVGRYDMAPSPISKVNTVLQIVLVLACVIHEARLAFNPSTIEALVYAVLVTTVASGAHYAFIWGRRALRARQGGAS